MALSLREAIDIIGQYKAADLADVKRPTVQAWHRKNEAPRWRARGVAAIKRAAERELAEQAQKAAA